MQSLMKLFFAACTGLGRGGLLLARRLRLAAPLRRGLAALVLAVFVFAPLFAPSVARAAEFEGGSNFTDAAGHLQSLTTGANPQISVPSTATASALATICNFIDSDDEELLVTSAQVGEFERGRQDGNVTLDSTGVTCNSAFASIMWLPAVVSIAFNPAAPPPGTSVTATATYTDPGGGHVIPSNGRSGHTWTITDSSSNAVTDTEGTATSNGTTHTTTFTMPASGNVTVVHSVTSGHGTNTPGDDATATRTVTLMPGMALPATPAPTAAAGTDQTGASAVDEGDTVSLTGTVTRDSADTTSTVLYRWRQITSETDTTEITSGDANYAGAITHVGAMQPSGDHLVALPPPLFQSTTAANASFTAPSVASDTTYYFQLTGLTLRASHTNGEATDIVAIEVKNVVRLETPSLTIADFNATEGGISQAGALALTSQPLTVTASVADDPDTTTVDESDAGTTLTYAWRQVSGTNPDASDFMAVTSGGGANHVGTITNANTASASFQFDSPASTNLYFEVTVTAARTGYVGSAATGFVTATITDVEPPTPGTITVEQISLLGGRTDLGASPVTVDEDTSIALISSTPTDPDGDTVTVLWAATADPATNPVFPFTSTNALEVLVFVPAHTEMQRATTYTVTITYSDSQNNTASDDFTVVVRDTDGTPSASAGTDQEVLTGAMVTLDGSATTNSGGANDDDIVYGWSQTATATSDTALASGDPNYVQLSGAGTDTATFTAPAAPVTLFFRLRASDTLTNTADFARVQVDVRAPRSISVTTSPNVNEGDRLQFIFNIAGGITRTEAVTVGATFGATAATTDTDAEAADFCTTSATAGAAAAFSGLAISNQTLAVGMDSLTVDGPWICDEATVEGTDEGFTVTYSVSGAGLTTIGPASSTIVIGPSDVPQLGNPASLTVTDINTDEGTLSAGVLVLTTHSLVAVATGPADDTATTVDESTATLAYEWRQVNGDDPTAMGFATVTDGPTISDSNMATATFQHDSPTTSTLYFQVRVTARLTGYTSSFATTVLTATIGDVEPPALGEIEVNVAGGTGSTADLTLLEGTATVNLLGPEATDPDSADGGLDGLAYEWSATADDGTAAAITFSPANDRTSVINALPEITPEQRSVAYTLQLLARDGGGNEATDTIVITVTDDDGVPTASAGTDLRVTTGDTMVGLNASGSTNGGGADNTDLSYAWIQTATADDSDTTALTSGDTGYVALTGATTAMPTFDAPTADATLHFQVTVTDSQTSGTSSDKVQVAVLRPTGIVITGGTASLSEGGSARLTFSARLHEGVTPAPNGQYLIQANVGASTASGDADASASDFSSGLDTTLSKPGLLSRGFFGGDGGAITVTDDNLVEGEEGFTVVFTFQSSGLNAAVLPFYTEGATIHGTITDDDGATLSIARSDSDGFTEGETGGPGSAVFTVSITGGATAVSVTPTFTVSGGTPGADYSINPAAVSGVYTLAIPAGNSEADITITSLDDNEIESAEIISVTLSMVSAGNSANVALSSTPADVTASAPLVDDDEAVVRLSRPTDGDGFTEGATGGAGSTDFRVTLGGTFGEVVTVPFTVGGVGITADDYDITAPGSIAATATGGSVVIAAGQTEGTITVQASNDDALEGAETLRVTLAAPTIGGGGTAPTLVDGQDTVTGDIVDDDSVTVTISTILPGTEVTEGQDVSLQVNVNGAELTAALEVDVTVSGTGITSGDHNVPATISVSPVSDSTTASSTTTVTITDDSDNEPMETLTVTISNPTTTGSASLGSITLVEIPIAASDPVVVTIARIGAADQDESTGSAPTDRTRVVFNVTRSATAGVATIPFSVTGADVSDFDIIAPLAVPDPAATSATLTLADGAAMGQINIELSADDLNEATETLTIEPGTIAIAGLSGPVEFAAASTNTIGILDQDPINSVTIAPAAATVQEGGNAVWTVTLDVASAAPMEVVYTVAVPNQVASTDSDGNTATNAGVSRPDFTAPASPLTIAAGDTTGEISVAIATDRLAEADEVLRVTVSSLTLTGSDGGTVNATAPAASDVTIASNSAATYAVTFGSSAPTTITEPADAASETATNIAVTLSGPSHADSPFTGNIEVDWAYAAPTGGAAAADFGSSTAPAGGTLTFTSAARTQNIAITVAHDSLSEGGSNGQEAFTLTLSKGSTLDTARETTLGGVQVVTSARDMAIVDDAADNIMVAIAGAPATFAEDGGTTTYTVTLSGGTTTADLTVDFTVTAGSSMPTTLSTADYDITTPSGILATADSGTLTIAAGDSMGTIVITGVADDLLEGNESLVLSVDTISGGGGRTPDDPAAPNEVAITDAESATVAFTRTDTIGNLNEGQTASFSVEVSGVQLTEAVVIDVDITGTGVTTSDYRIDNNAGIAVQPIMTTVTGTFDVVALDDSDNEPAETMTIAITLDTAGTATTTMTEEVIINASDPVTFTVARSGTGAVAEGGEVSFSVTRDMQIGGAGTVAFTVGGTGITADDYDITAPAGLTASDTGGMVSFGANDLTANITLSITTDNLNEAEETLTVTGGAVAFTGLPGPTPYATGGDSADAAISESDPATLGIARASGSGNIAEGESVDFTVSLSGASAGSANGVMVPWTAAVTSQANSAGDNTDSLPDLRASGATATATMLSGTLTLTTESTEGTITITAANDSLAEGVESFTVTLGDPTPVAGSGTVTLGQGTSITAPVGIDASEAAQHVVSVAGPDAALDEETASAMATFTLTLPAVTGANVRTGNLVVAYTLGGTATAGSDYTAPTTMSVTFAAADTEQTVNIPLMNDTINEGAETIIMTLGAITDEMSFLSIGGAAAVGSATATISQSDDITYSIGDPAAVTEPDSGTADMTFTVTLSGASAGSVTVPFSVSALSTAVAGTDYTAPTATSITVAAGDMTGTVDIEVLADDLNEGEDTIILEITAGVTPGDGAGMVSLSTASGAEIGTGAISANDPIVLGLAGSGRFDQASVSEGGNLTASVFTQNVRSQDAICVTFSVAVTQQNTAAGAAANTGGNPDVSVTGCDGMPVSVSANGEATGGVNIPAGDTQATITIGTVFDNLDEGDTAERVTITLTTASMAGPRGGPINLHDTATSVSADITNVNAARTLAVAADSATAAEGGNAAFTITVSGQPVTAGFDVTWTLTGTAAAADYTGAATGTVSFGVSTEGTQTQAVMLPVVDDALNEGPETLILTLSDPCPDSGICAAGGRPGDLPDDAPSLQLTGGPATATIGASDPISVTLARSTGDTGRLVSGDAVNFVATLGATASTDLALQITAMAGSTAVTVPDVAVASGATEAAFSIAACDDTTTTGCLNAGTLAASGEVQLAVSVSGVTGAPTGATAAPDATNAAAANIAMVGWELSISPLGSATTPTTVGEGGPLTLTVSLRGTPAPTALMIPWQVAGSGASPATAADFTGGAFPGDTLDLSGAASGTISVPTLTDTEDESAAAEGFTVTLGAFTGANAGAVVAAETVAYAVISDALRTLAVGAVSATLNEDDADAAATTGPAATAEFTITMSGTESPVEAVEVTWRLSSPDPGFTLQPSGAGLGRNLGARDLQPGQALTGTVTFPAGTSLTPPAVMRVMVPIAQDALNEGAERLRLTLDTVDPTAGGREPNTDPGITGTLVSQERAEVTVAASDAMTIFLAPVSDQGTLVSGEAANYEMSFGTTMVNGVAVPIVPTTALMVPVMVTVGGTTSTITVPVAAGAATAPVEVPAATVNPPGSTSRTTLTVAVGTPTGLPAGATAQAGTQAQLDAQPEAPTKPAVVTASPTFAPQQVAGWELTVTQPSGDQAPEGTAYQVVFTLEGDAARLAAGGLTSAWSVAPRAAAVGSQMAAAGDFGPSTSTPPAYTCGAPAGGGACTSFPSGTVTFNTGVGSVTLSIAIFDDGVEEGMTPEGFTLNLGTLGGSNAGNTSLATGTTLPATLAVEIPALRVDLSIANATADEGESAMFTLSLGNLSGGDATTQPIVVAYTLGGGATDTATSGQDYTQPAVLAASIAAGAANGATQTIAIPLVADGVVEPPETFTLTITGASGGGGTVRLVNADGEEQTALTATGTISGAGDAARRRGERVSTLVSVLDRSTAVLATSAIGQRLDRGMPGSQQQSAQLSLANRNLIGDSSLPQAADSELGLALYGAAGLGGAAAGLPGGGGAAGAGETGGAARQPGVGGAFGGLGAGLAGGANMGSQTELPSLSQLLQGSRFNFAAAGWMDFTNVADGAQFWGSGGFANLDGDPNQGTAKLNYDGDHFGFFVGADRPLRDDLLAGVAVGYSVGDLSFTDSSPGGFSQRGTLSSNMLSVHPYVGWWITPNLNTWLVLGYGSGSVDMEETDTWSGGEARRTLPEDSDSNMWMFSAGAKGSVQVATATGLKLSVELTRVHSDLQAASFTDGARLPKISAHSMRVGGEAEIHHRLQLGAAQIEPFVTARMRIESGDSVEQGAGQGRDAAFDVGGGVSAILPDLGVDARISVSGQLNETGHKEQSLSLDMNYDPGADSQGITLAVQTALTEKSGGLLASTAGLSGLGNGGSSLGGSLSSSLNRMERTISGELGYGMAFRQFGSSGLLTPYGRFNLGQSNSHYAAGLRLQAPGGLSLGLESGLLLNEGAAAAGSDFQVLLKGQLRF